MNTVTNCAVRTRPSLPGRLLDLRFRRRRLRGRPGIEIVQDEQLVEIAQQWIAQASLSVTLRIY
jgi:hypothetical protein